MSETPALWASGPAPAPSTSPLPSAFASPSAASGGAYGEPKPGDAAGVMVQGGENVVKKVKDAGT